MFSHSDDIYYYRRESINGVWKEGGSSVPENPAGVVLTVVPASLPSSASTLITLACGFTGVATAALTARAARTVWRIENCILAKSVVWLEVVLGWVDRVVMI